MEIALTAQEEAALSAFEAAVQDRPEILECYLMSGEYDYLLRVVVADFADYERIHREHLTRLPFVGRVRSSFTLRTVLRRTSIPLAGRLRLFCRELTVTQGPAEHAAVLNGVSLHWFEWGAPGPEPTIVLIHATGFHARCWDQVVKALPGRHVLALDLRGHGRSGKRRLFLG